MASDMATVPPVASPSPIGGSGKGGAHPGLFTRHAAKPGHSKGRARAKGTGRRARKGKVR